MQVITTVQEMLKVRASWATTETIGLVPTMGYLHEGHLALVRQARAENKVLVASIFVNPMQFGPHEDLARYPRDLPRDLHLLENCGVDAVFTPAPANMYPEDFVTYVDPSGPLVTSAEGASRPGHFRGVATVVLKLFQIIRPERAYFGQKDAQQVAVISRMVADLNLPVTLRIHPTIREADGLAMSSRNAYLTPAARAKSTILYRALMAGKEVFENAPSTDPVSVAQVIARMRAIIASEPGARLDYIEVRDPATFLPLETLQAPALLLIAATIEATRLIDNILLRADGTWDNGTLEH
ncbi:MAG TPA: pantoate--beta-alanine ligase [Ktedonobacteraceae bacterium]|jgi:pantoate--beta-alanine ligase